MMEPRLSFVPALAATSALSSVSRSPPLLTSRPVFRSMATDVQNVPSGSSSCTGSRQSASLSGSQSTFHGQTLERQFEFTHTSSSRPVFHLSVDAVATDRGIPPSGENALSSGRESGDMEDQAPLRWHVPRMSDASCLLAGKRRPLVHPV
eukprot:EC120615.1.p1 GENE.EC120615.1~~EC120615.1.p1  ORF type:complete len:150 (+),score=24.59 EC120615.1:67-516(+)